MNRDSVNDMEQIQKGLEDFLDNEINYNQGQDSGTGQESDGYEEGYDTENASWDDIPADMMNQTKERRASEGRQNGSAGRASGNMNDNRASAVRSRKKKRRRRKWRRRLLILLFVLLIIILLVYFGIGSIYNRMDYDRIDSVSSESMSQDGVINILLIGNDSREDGADGRSDAMILLSISSRTKTISMISLLRDIYVDIPGHSSNRLNAAYAYGGAELLMETIEYNFGITVNRYMQVNFEAFANLVDAVGGVDIDVTSAEVEYINAYLWEYNELVGNPEGTDYLDTSLSGELHLNGPQALAYCRNRYIGTDFGRTQRQRKVLTAIMKELPVAMITSPGEVSEALLDNLTTNLTQTECMTLVTRATSLLTYDVIQDSIPIEGSYSDVTIDGMAVLRIDFDVNREFLITTLYGN